jgi:ribonuclease P protein component
LRLETLKRRSEFDRLRKGRKWVATSFILQGAPRGENRTGGGPRFGFVVASKALRESGAGKGAHRPGAVMRNRARRRLKEAVRLVAPEDALTDFDYVIIARRESLHQRFTDLLEELQLAFGKVNRPPRAGDGMVRPGRQHTAEPRQNQGHLEAIAGEAPVSSRKSEGAGRAPRVTANDGRK